MSSSEIYTDFSEDIDWIRERIKEEIPSPPNPLGTLAEYYVKKRLLILPDSARQNKFDPELPTPIPYAVFWLAQAFGLTDQQVIRRFGLQMLHFTLATTIQDDVVDRETASELHAALANMYLHKYFSTFVDLLSPSSGFWHYLPGYIEELATYDRWNLASRCEVSDPFSETFLRDSSRNLPTVSMPTLAAIAIMTDNEEKIPAMNRFMKQFCMAWRIYDDLKDWREDLNLKNLSHSSILIHALNNSGGRSDLREDMVLSTFLDPDFVDMVYGSILGFIDAAKKEASVLNCPYLSKFLDEQISFHSRRRDSMLRSCSDFYERLRGILDKYVPEQVSRI